MLSKKSKIEQLAKSHENRFLAASAAASLGRTYTKLCGRLLVTRCGPPWRGPDAPTALKNLVHLPENTFSTASTHSGLAARKDDAVQQHAGIAEREIWNIGPSSRLSY